MLHYMCMSYFAINMNIQPIKTLVIYDYYSLLLLFSLFVFILWRVRVSKVTYTKLLSNFSKVKYGTCVLLLYITCILSSTTQSLHIYEITLSYVVYYVIPLCVTAWTTIERYNTTTKIHGNFLNFVRM